MSWLGKLGKDFWRAQIMPYLFVYGTEHMWKLPLPAARSRAE